MRSALLMTMVAFAASACSVDGVGMLMADAFDAGDATIVRLRAMGAQLRTRADDAGVTIGLTERLYVFDHERRDDLPDVGRHYWSVRLPDRPSLALATQSLGAE